MPPKRAKKTPVQAGGAAAAAAAPPVHVTTVGVKRPGFGKVGRATTVIVNHFPCKIPTSTIYHYDVAIGDGKLPARANVQIMRTLQEQLEPNIFSPRGAYDGRKNLFTIKKLALGDNDTRTFEMPLGNPNPDRPPRTRRVKITLVAQINPELLSQFQLGRHAQDEEVQTALQALNVALRHEPISRYTFNTRSFFMPTGLRSVGMGLELWPGVFQSIRPAINSMHINIDTSTGVIYKPGPLITHALEFMGRRNPTDLALNNLSARDKHSLQSRLRGLRIALNYIPGKRPEKSIIAMTTTNATNTMFESNGQRISVAQYFQQTLHKQVRFPTLPCVQISRTAIVPMEFCDILPGQLMRKQIPQELTDEMVNFSRKRPEERLAAIRNSLPALGYHSEVVSQFGIEITPEPIEAPARVLESPQVMYSRPVRPNNGAWNLRQEKLKMPAQIKGWIMVIFDRQNFFDQTAVKQTIERLKAACEEKGIIGLDLNPLVEYAPAQGDVQKSLRDAGGKFRAARGTMPNLIVAIMPKQSGDIYPAVKHFGDVAVGVATQCLKAQKCRGGNPQYFGNVCLKINVKLGGINSVLPPSDDKFLGDPANPTMILGADVAHPAPGTEGKPSFTALVGSVDSAASKYIATHRAQKSRVEGIVDLQEMAEKLIKMFQGYQKMVEKKATVGPKRILFYRDGVSEGQFKFVLENELPALKRACEACGLKPLPKITLVIVGKRHHTRMFPKPGQAADKSGNCAAGTVIDQLIGHPLEFDFFLLSHGGLIGTSRPAHYSVVHDDNNFTPDSLQKLTFNLCHVYARATRSVSIPPPVYYADIVCARAKNHLPQGQEFDLSDTMSVASGSDANAMLERIKAAYRPTHPNLEKNMYFQ